MMEGVLMEYTHVPIWHLGSVWPRCPLLEAGRGAVRKPGTSELQPLVQLLLLTPRFATRCWQVAVPDKLMASCTERAWCLWHRQGKCWNGFAGPEGFMGPR